MSSQDLLSVILSFGNSRKRFLVPKKVWRNETKFNADARNETKQQI